jgi:hypothetical protein
MQNALIWALVAVGYLVPGIVFGLALRPAAELLRRSGGATGELR